MQVHLIFWFISAVSGAPLLCENVMNCTRLATSVADIITVRQSAGCCFHNDCEQGRWPVFLMNLISNLLSTNFPRVPAQHPWPGPHMLAAWPYYSKNWVHATGVYYRNVYIFPIPQFIMCQAMENVTQSGKCSNEEGCEGLRALSGILITAVTSVSITAQECFTFVSTVN